MKIVNITILIFFNFCLMFSQTKKNNWKLKGDLIFKVSISITNESEFKNSIVSYKKIFIESSRRAWKITKDSSEIKKREELNEKLMKGDFIERTMFHPNTVYYIEGKYAEDSIVICSKKTLTEKSNPNKCEFLTSTRDKRYNPIEIVDIKEFKNIKKTIFGYNCFKIVYRFKVTEGERNYFSENIIYKHEAWVTNDIKTPFNPLFSDDKIVSKYFPLEIRETIDGVEGYEIIYEPFKINVFKK